MSEKNGSRHRHQLYMVNTFNVNKLKNQNYTEKNYTSKPSIWWHNSRKQGFHMLPVFILNSNKLKKIIFPVFIERTERNEKNELCKETCCTCKTYIQCPQM